MASVGDKLYPPTVGSSIPAFYNEDGTVIITVPFSMSRAVSADSVGGFSLKIKTAQSNAYLETLTTSDSVKSFIAEQTVVFYWDVDDDSFKRIKLG